MMSLKKIMTGLFLAVLSTSSIEARAVEVAFERDPSLPMVFVNFTIKAGTVTDPKELSGLTNFTGEMLIRGTKTKTKEQIDLALDQMGAKLEIEARAEALILRGAVLSSQLGPFLQLLEEVVTQPSFPEAEIRKLKSEINSAILEELGNDGSLANRKFYQFLFRDHSYGKPVLGSVKGIERTKRDNIVAHYQRLFRDKQLLVVGSGDADSSKIEDWSKNVAMALEKQNGGFKSEPITTVAAPQNAPSRRVLIVDKPERTQTQVNMGQIGIRMTDPSYFPLYLGNFAFGGGSFSARLMVEIRVKRGWSYGANSFFRAGLQPRSWQAHLFPAAKDTPAATEQTLKMITELKEKGITADEFSFAQQSLVNSSGFMYNTSKKRVENKLLEKTLDLPDGFMKSYGEELAKVKLEDVNSSLKEFLKPEQLAIVVVGTADQLKEPLAKAAGVPVEQVQVQPYTAE